LGDAARRPLGKRSGEGLGQRILGAGDVARSRREVGNEPAIALARHGLGRLASANVFGARHRADYICQIGRTSIVP
jgi:hypothetical protein